MHNIKKLMFAPALMLAITLAAASSFAIGSGKSDEEKAEENKQKAVRAYNEGVEKMDAARAAAIKGDSAFAYNYRATSDAKAKKAYEKAIDKFREAVDKDPGMAIAHNNLGYCYRRVGKFEKSLEAYQTALELDPEFAQAREYLGETYLAMGNIDKAQEQLAWLTNAESPYADTLQASIDLYKLKEVEKKMKSE